MQFEDFALKTNVLAFASRSKAKAKPQRRTPACSSTRTIQTYRWQILDWYWARKLFVYRLPSVKTTEYSSSSWSSTSRRRWSDWILEIEGLSSKRFWCDLNICMWKSTMAKKAEETSGQEILCFRALQGHSGRNPIDPSFKDNVLIPNDFFEYIYHIGCAINLHSIINSGLIPGGQNFEQKTDGILYGCESHGQGIQRSVQAWLDPTTSCMVQAENVEETSKHCIGSIYSLLNGKDWSSIKHDRTQSSFTTHSQVIVFRRLSWWNLEIIYEKVYMSPRLPPKFFFKTIGCRNWVQKLLEVVKTIRREQTQPKTKNPVVRTGRPVLAEQPSRSSAQEIDNRVLRGCESTDVSFERSDRDKDADENVDADQTSTERPVESGQSIGLFTQREEIDIDFRVSGLPHAVVKQAENFRVRELVKKMESHTHREALQADLQQSDAYNPFSEKSKKMIREMGNVELFELCGTIPKVQCSECLLYWNQGIVYCTCGHLLWESESSQHFHQWRLDAFSIPHYVIKKGRPRGARHGKTDAQKQLFLAHNARRRCIKKNFDGFHDRFQRDPLYRDSQLKNWLDRGEVHRDG